jgi:tellurite resistance-related uncharacterized protein
MNAPATPSSKAPYKCAPIFNETTLPAGLRREHRTKFGAWGVIQVLDGRLRYQVLDPSFGVILEPGQSALILPDQPHFVEPLGPVRMQVQFYDHLPDLYPPPDDRGASLTLVPQRPDRRAHRRMLSQLLSALRSRPAQIPSNGRPFFRRGGDNRRRSVGGSATRPLPNT